MPSATARKADVRKVRDYERRRPERTLLYQLIEEHYPRYIARPAVATDRLALTPQGYVRELVTNAIWHEPFSAESAAALDPGDDHLWHLVNTLEEGILVTGDQLLLDNPPDYASALSPRSFVDLLL